MDTFGLKIIASDRVFYEGRCRKLVIPAPDGEKGILPNHENMVIAVKIGMARMEIEEGNECRKEYELNKQLAQMLKGGVIMDVTTPEQARIAEEAGACAVMALERIPADMRAAGGVSRMSDPKMIKEIQEAVSIPVMAKCRIGHFVEDADIRGNRN